MMEIAVLDGYTLCAGKLDMKAFEALGEIACYDRTLPENLVGM